MLPVFIITLREGLEAFLIVAISLTYLRRSGRSHLAPAVHWGIGVSILISVGASLLLKQASNQALWEGVLALAAAVMVGSLTIHMWRFARRLKGEIESRLDRSSRRTGAAGFTGVFLFTLLMISREGMETALLMNALLFQVPAKRALLGALAGIFCAAGTAWLWTRFGKRMNLARFFQVTAIFLLVFVVQLAVYGFHELTESGLLPNSEALHWATEPYGPDGQYGQYFSYLLVLLPLGWLAVSSLRSGESSAP